MTLIVRENFVGSMERVLALPIGLTKTLPLYSLTTKIASPTTFVTSRGPNAGEVFGEIGIARSPSLSFARLKFAAELDEQQLSS